MKVKVRKYHPNFVDVDKEIDQIIEINGSFDLDHAAYVVWDKVDYLADKIGKLHYNFHTFTKSLIMYDDPKSNHPWPIAWVTILEI